MSARQGRGALLALAPVGIALAATLVSAAPANRPTVAGDGVHSGAAASEPTAQPTSPRLSSSQTKPVAPIAIDYDFSAQPALGVPFDVRIAAAGGGSIGDLQLAVVADDGLEAGAPQLTAGSADGVQRNWTVSATAFKSGTLYLTLLVQGTTGDQHPSRDVVIPVRIGTTTGAPTTATSQSVARPRSQQVIASPAERAR